jgi:hypothetical protein
VRKGFKRGGILPGQDISTDALGEMVDVLSAGSRFSAEATRLFTSPHPNATFTAFNSSITICNRRQQKATRAA